MLQQTQTGTVLGYYERFLRRFPSVKALAQASEPEVLQLWAGLGYYSRARNLHRAAKRIVETHKSFPAEFSAIIALPGIGRYTAGAICSIAFNQPYPVVDGNIRRVLTRVSGIREHIPESFFWNLMSAWVPARNPSSFNQGMMELGALICIPFQPKCPQCPVKSFCEARRAGIETAVLSVRAKRSDTRTGIVLLVLRRNRRILLSKMPQGGLIPGDWGFPWQIVPDGESVERAAVGLCRSVLGRKISLEASAPVRHRISNHQITASVFFGRTELQAFDRRSGEELLWVNRFSVEPLLTSSLFRKALHKMQ